MSRDVSPWLTVEEAADHLRVSVVTIRRWTAKGLLKSYPLGPRMRRWKKADLDLSLGYGHILTAEEMDALRASP